MYPFSVDALLRKHNEEIVHAITYPQLKEQQDGANQRISATDLGKAVAKEPQKFAAEIDLYKAIPFVYKYHLLKGFKEACTYRKIFSWQNVLYFISTNLADEPVYTA